MTMYQIRRLKEWLDLEQGEEFRASARSLPLLVGLRYDNATLREIDDRLREIRAAIRREQGGSPR